MLRRILGFFLMLLGVAGLAVAVAGSVAIWQVRVDLDQRAEHLGEKTEKLLNVAIESLHQVAELLKQGSKDLDSLRETAQAPPPKPQPNGFGKFLANKLLNEFEPRLNGARDKLTTVLDAAVVINTVLEGLENVPAVKLVDLKPDEMRDLSGNLTGVIGSAKKLQALLENDPDSAADVAANTADMKAALAEAVTRLNQLAGRAATAKERVVEVRGELPGWLTVAALAVTGFLVWFGLGQLCLTVRGVKWLFARVSG